MLKYAKYISQNQIKYPVEQDFKGVVNPLQHDKLLRKNEYYPLMNMPEEKQDKILILDKFQLTKQTKIIVQPRQKIVDDFVEDTVTFQKIKIGSHEVIEDTPIQVDDSFISVISFHYEDIPSVVHSYDDYDRAMQEYMLKVRCERGWTSRQPDTIQSSNPRYKQDGIDFANFRDKIFAYVLPILNKYNEDGIIPDWDEYLNGLYDIKCKWTYKGE